MTAPVLTGTGAAHVTGTGAGFAPHRGDERIATCVEIGYGPPQTFGVPNGQWVDVTPNVRQLATQRGRSQELQRFEAGTLTMRLDNRTGTYSIWAGSGMGIGCPIRVRISAEKNNPTGATPSPAVYDPTDGGFYHAWYGFIESVDYDWADGGMGDAWCTITAVDAFSLLNNAQLVGQIFPQFTATKTFGGIADLSGEHAVDRLIRAIDVSGVKQLLPGCYIYREDKDLGGFPDNWTPFTLQLNSGASNPVTEAVLSHMQTIAEAGFVDFYQRPDGMLCWRAFSEIRDNAFDGTTTFGDHSGEIPYSGLAPSYDNQNLFNDATLVYQGPETDAFSDATSIATYGDRLYQRSYPTIVLDDGLGPTSSAVHAQDIVAKFKDPIVYCPSITVDLRALTDAQRMRVLSLPIGYRVHVVRRPAGGDTLTAECHFEGVSLTWLPGMIDVRAVLNLAPVRPPGTYVGPLPL